MKSLLFAVALFPTVALLTAACGGAAPTPTPLAEPEDAQSYYQHGLGFLQSGELDKAVADFTRALELDPQIPGAYLNRAWAYTLLKRDREAQADIERAVELGIDRGLAQMIVEQGKQLRESPPN